MKEKTDLGIKIRDARKAAGMNQTELADRLGKTMRTVQKYESGEIEPSFAMLNEIAKVLNVSPSHLIGYQKQEIHIETLSDVLYVINELNKKAGIHFDVTVKKPDNDGEWNCTLKFDGNNKDAELNQDLCLFLERYSDEIENLDNTAHSKAQFDHWFETELSYYSNITLKDKSVDEG